MAKADRRRRMLEMNFFMVPILSDYTSMALFTFLLKAGRFLTRLA
jgi:hypothetical protein